MRPLPYEAAGIGARGMRRSSSLKTLEGLVFGGAPVP